MRKRDFILASIVVLVISVVFLISGLLSKKGQNAEVYLNNEILLIIDLSIDDTYIINGNISECKIEVKEGKIGIVENKCPDHTCINMGFIDSSSRTIICIPNGIMIKIISDEIMADVDI